MMQAKPNNITTQSSSSLHVIPLGRFVSFYSSASEDNDAIIAAHLNNRDA